VNFLRFAKALQLYSGSELPNPHLWESFLSRKDNTVRTVDLYFSDSAIQRFKRITRDQFWKDFVEVMLVLEPDLGELPFANKEVLKTYFRGGRCYDFQLGIESPSTLLESEVDQLAGKYKAEHDRKISIDAKYYIVGKQIFETLKGKDKSDIDWKPLVELGKKYKFDYFIPVAVCVALCDRKEVFVHQLELKGHLFTIKSQDEEQLHIPESMQLPEEFYLIEET